jgi:hypothetical protein
MLAVPDVAPEQLLAPPAGSEPDGALPVEPEKPDPGEEEVVELASGVPELELSEPEAVSVVVSGAVVSGAVVVLFEVPPAS